MCTSQTVRLLCHCGRVLQGSYTESKCSIAERESLLDKKDCPDYIHIKSDRPGLPCDVCKRQNMQLMMAG
jgi:hypothetical protein